MISAVSALALLAACGPADAADLVDAGVAVGGGTLVGTSAILGAGTAATAGSAAVAAIPAVAATAAIPAAFTGEVIMATPFLDFVTGAVITPAGTVLTDMTVTSTGMLIGTTEAATVFNGTMLATLPSGTVLTTVEMGELAVGSVYKGLVAGVTPAVPATAGSPAVAAKPAVAASAGGGGNVVMSAIFPIVGMAVLVNYFGYTHMDRNCVDIGSTSTCTYKDADGKATAYRFEQKLGEEYMSLVSVK